MQRVTKLNRCAEQTAIGMQGVTKLNKWCVVWATIAMQKVNQ